MDYFKITLKRFLVLHMFYSQGRSITIVQLNGFHDTIHISLASDNEKEKLKKGPVVLAENRLKNFFFKIDNIPAAAYDLSVISSQKQKEIISKLHSHLSITAQSSQVILFVFKVKC